MKILLSVIGVVLLLVIAGDAYLLQLKKNTTAPVVPEVVVQPIIATSTKNITSPPATTTPSATLPRAASPVELSVLANYKGNPLEVLITCKIHTTKELSGISIYPGDGSVDVSDANTSKTKVYDQTFSNPGTYTIGCFPSYTDGSNKVTSFDSPNITKKTITLGGYRSSNNSLAFHFQPTSATFPVHIVASCSVATTGKVTEMGIYEDDFNTFQPGQNIPNKFLELNSNNTDGVPSTLTEDFTMQRDPYWTGVHKVYCEARINDGAPIVSSAITINYQ